MNFVSIIITVYNTLPEYFKECIDSIKCQEGNFNIELIVVDDGSSEDNYNEYKILLDNLEKQNENVKVIYFKSDKNYGIGYASRKAVELCTNEIIYKLDSDDIMSPNRLKVQWDFMEKNPDYPLCSGDIRMFSKINNEIILKESSNHSEILTWDYFKFNAQNKHWWHTNQPLFCFRKSCVLAVGNYDADLTYYEDTILTAKILNKYGKIYNIKSLPVLLLYRVHETNTTSRVNGKDKDLENLMLTKLNYCFNNQL